MDRTASAAKKAANKPVQAFRLHGISVSVFANVIEHKGRTVTFYKTSVQKSYRDGDQGFKTTTSFEADDLPIVCFLLVKAYAFIGDQELAATAKPVDD